MLINSLFTVGLTYYFHLCRHCWCFKCLSIPKLDCVVNNHNIADHAQDVAKIEELQTKLLGHLTKAADGRNQLQIRLQVRVANLQKELTLATTTMNLNSTALRLLRSSIDSCLDRTGASRVLSFFAMTRDLEKKVTQAENELENVKELKAFVGVAVNEQVSRIFSTPFERLNC